MQREGVSELEAHARLEEQARQQRRSVLETAEEITRAIDTQGPERVTR
jgi:AmiR/NasT family two-component response regulator